MANSHSLTSFLLRAKGHYFRHPHHNRHPHPPIHKPISLKLFFFLEQRRTTVPFVHDSYPAGALELSINEILMYFILFVQERFIV